MPPDAPMFPTAHAIDELQTLLTGDLFRFLPELLVCGGIVALLLARLVSVLDRIHLGGLATGAIVAALAAAVLTYPSRPAVFGQGTFFAGMLVADPFAGFVRVLVLAAALVTVLLTRLTGIPDRDDSADFYALLLGGTLGMMLMASAGHLLMVFIAVEMASLPSYALAGFLKGRRQGSEAALKYVVFGAAASGVMLYGISLVAGSVGSGSLTTVADRLVAQIGLGGVEPVLLTGLALFAVGLGFKLAAVPFHFWCPDVFDGAAAEVGGFLSVASKAAAVALTMRILLSLQAHAVAVDRLAIPGTFGVAIGVVGAITVTLGNLAAFWQSNLKRLLAYSTIAHAGYMLLAVAAVSLGAAAAVLYYLAAYLLMNLGAFAVVALVRNATGSEEIGAYRGLVRRSPTLAVTMAVFLFSLVGFPPLAGFAGKFQVFVAVGRAGIDAAGAGRPGLATTFYVLFGIGAVNTAVSAYYYLRVARAMMLDEPADPSPIRVTPPAAGFLALLGGLLVALGIIWNPVTTAAENAAASFTPPGAHTEANR